jgi:hypothetical protein
MMSLEIITSGLLSWVVVRLEVLGVKVKNLVERQAEHGLDIAVIKRAINV